MVRKKSKKSKDGKEKAVAGTSTSADGYVGTEEANGMAVGSQKLDSQATGDMSAEEQKAVNKWGGRMQLPTPAVSRNNFSVWTFLKHCIGKELSKITMPVIFNEPLSFLQRLAEGMEYIHLLDNACDQDDPLLRIQYVTAYAVSSVASNAERIAKPFNPLLGETFELDRHDKGFRVVMEQVSHHPPVTAYCCESTTGRWRVFGSVHPKLKLWGKSIEIVPEGQSTVELIEHKEAYSVTHVSCVVHNIIFGEMWMEQVGQLQITNLSTKHKAQLNFRPLGWFGKELHKLDGYVLNDKKEKIVALYGKWNIALYSVDVPSYEAFTAKKKDNTHKLTKQSSDAGASSDGILHEIPFIPNSTLLWQQDTRPSRNVEDNYNFSFFAMMLNELTDELRRKIAPTDSRLRPDIQLLEHADLDGAADAKLALEEKQRQARKIRNQNKETWKPRWFYEGANPHTGVTEWLYLFKYWDKNWTDCPDIFC